MTEHTPFDLPDRFWAKTREDESGCLIWTASTNSSGYGCFSFAGTIQLAHRVAYLSAGHEIPEGWHVDHLCRVRTCVRVDHLEAVTPGENNRRMVAALTVQYPHGRSYPTVTHPTRDMGRYRATRVHADLPHLRRRCPECPDKAA